MLAWVLSTPLLIVMRKRNSLETPRNQLIYSYNLILLGTRSLNRHMRDYLKQAGQWEELIQRYKSRKGKAEKSKDTKIQHTVQKIMPGVNCAIVGCSTNRRHKDISLLRLPTAKPCLLLRLNLHGKHLAIQLLWVTARLLVTRPIALPTQWMNKARCESSPLPGVSATVSAKISEHQGSILPYSFYG